MTVSDPPGSTSGAAVTVPEVRHQVRVKASPARAYEVFTDGFGTWWPKHYTVLDGPVERAVVEARPGGRCYDRGVDGGEGDWGRVLAVDPPHRIVIAWQLTGRWQYDADLEHASRVTVTFSEADGGTVVELVHDRFERHPDGAALAEGVRDGWGGALQGFAAAVQAVGR